MQKLKRHRIVMVLLTLVLLFGVSAQSTLAYLQADAEPVKNTFVPVKSVVHDLDISVTGEKALTGRDWQKGDSFIFMLQLWDADKEEWVTVGTDSVAYDKDNGDFDQFDMSELVREQITEPRYYTFRVVEGQGSLPNMTYDERICKFLVTVTADDTGAMDITEVVDKENTVVTQDSETGDFAVAMKFTNTYTEPPEPPVVPDPDDITFNFEIAKKVKNIGDEEIGPGGFNFALEKNSTGEVWTKTTDSDGAATFRMSYNKDDIGKIYIYELSEVDDGQEGVTYDSREYEIKVGIELNEEENVLVPSITLDGKEVSKVEVDFENVYEVPEEPSEPTDPSEPTEPADPSEPTDPSDPTDTDHPATDPTEPGGTDIPEKDKGIQTGDDFMIFLYLAMMFTSAVIIALLIVGQVGS